MEKKLTMYKSNTLKDAGINLHNGEGRYLVKNADHFFVGGFIDCFWDHSSWRAQLYKFYSMDNFGVEEDAEGKTPRKAINNLLAKFDMKLDIEGGYLK
tara:strand:+ start:283 stop:576 length:294 start_codon:yes stop_codon:yes gene_type:complete